jgi:ADP-heptose:LPS heptosyltransferase
MDLVITVDTALAHLAGAMGVAVWNIVAFAPDWRWGLVRSDCPWYPTMRLYRQTVPGQWGDVFAAIRDELGSRRL